MKVKICGITKDFEIDSLNILKPEYIGFVFSKSIRKVSKQQAKTLKSGLDKDIKVVGVFRNEEIDFVVDCANFVDLDIIQLHGSEDMEYIDRVKCGVGKDVDIFKAISIKDSDSVKKLDEFNVDKFLLDSTTPGGGKTFDINNIKDLKCRQSIFVAGGITPDNVLDVIKAVNPYGVDLSSGVEEVDEHGNKYKSFDKMKKLIEEVRSYDKRKIQ